MARKKKFSKKKTDRKESVNSKDSVSTTDVKEETAKETAQEVSRGVSPGNDPAWYSIFPSLLRDSASLMYSDPLGSMTRLFSRGFTNAAYGNMYYRDNAGARALMGLVKTEVDAKMASVPGLLALKLQNTLGYSVGRESAINQMANQVYTQVRYVNSGRKNYDPCDLIIYIQAVIELYSFIFWCRRIYNESFVYSQLNRFVGNVMLEAECVDAQDFKMHLNDFRAWLNTFILNVSSYCIPSTIALTAKKVFQYAGIYIENAFGNVKDQMYMFTPSTFFSFALDSDGRGKLTPIPVQAYPNDPTPGLPNTSWDDTKMKTTDIMKIGNYLLNQIIQDEDFSLMSGDVLKAFAGNVMTLDPVGEEGGIMPIYDPYVLSQFKNATILSTINREPNNTWAESNGHKCGEIFQTADGMIECTNILCKQKADSKGIDNEIVSLSMAKILTLDNPAPMPADNIEATRLTCCGGKYFPASGHVVVQCGTEIAVAAASFSFKSGVVSKTYFSGNFTMIGDYLAAPGLAVAATSAFRSFKFAPSQYLGISNSAGDSIDDVIIIQDVDQYTIIGDEEIEKMHKCAMFSLLFVPTVAKNFNG